MQDAESNKNSLKKIVRKNTFVKKKSMKKTNSDKKKISEIFQSS